VRSNAGMTLIDNELTRFHSNKNIFTVDLKHSSFWLSADVKPVSIDLVRTLPWQCIFGRHDNQHNDIQHNDAQHKVLISDTKHRRHSVL
jgi:hypothetical protein